MINQSVADSVKGVARAIASAVIAFILVITVFATTAFADMVSTYNVEILVDNDKYAITTSETQPIEILSKANIALFETDKIDISGFVAGKGGVIAVDRLKTISIKYAKNIKTYSVYGDTVGEACRELGLSVNNKSKLNYKLSDAIVDGMIINIKSANHVKLKVDGKTVKYPITSGTVGDLIELAQVQLGEDDYVSPSMSKKLKKNMTVTVNRVKYRTQTDIVEVKYGTDEIEDKSQYNGIRKVVSDGENGKARVTYKVKYVNGRKKTKKAINKVVIKEATNEVVKVGAKKTEGTTEVEANGVTTRNGYSVGQKINGNFTHYCACGTCGSGTGRTASGLKVYNGMKDPYYIACNWLPLGSVVNIDGANYTVVDRGGSGLSRVGRVDIFTPEGHRACFRYGRGSCDLTIIRIGW